MIVLRILFVMNGSIVVVMDLINLVGLVIM